MNMRAMKFSCDQKSLPMLRINVRTGPKDPFFKSSNSFASYLSQHQKYYPHED